MVGELISGWLSPRRLARRAGCLLLLDRCGSWSPQFAPSRSAPTERARQRACLRVWLLLVRHSVTERQPATGERTDLRLLNCRHLINAPPSGELRDWLHGSTLALLWRRRDHTGLPVVWGAIVSRLPDRELPGGGLRAALAAGPAVRDSAYRRTLG
jgi:hypothetical protein